MNQIISICKSIIFFLTRLDGVDYHQNFFQVDLVYDMFKLTPIHVMVVIIFISYYNWR